MVSQHSMFAFQGPNKAYLEEQKFSFLLTHELELPQTAREELGSPS